MYSCSLSFFLILLLFFRNTKINPTIASIIPILYPIIECVLLSYFYYLLLRTKNKKIILFSATILLCFAFLIDFLFNKRNPSFLPLALEGFFYIVIIMYFFYEKVKYISNAPLYSISSFWISIAFLITFSGTFFLYLFSISMMNKDPAFKYQYNIIYGCFTILKNTLLCIAVFVNRTSNISIKEKMIAPNLDLDTSYP